MEKTNEQLAEVSQKLDTIIAIMRTPENKAVKVLEMIATIAGAFSLLTIFDVIKNWLGL